MLDLLPSGEAWLAFLTLSALEIVLGIDNLIFIAILITRLPEERRRMARVAGLGLAMVTRIALLYSIVWLTRLTYPWFRIADQEVSGRDVVLLCGGLFLLGKSVLELHHSVEGETKSADSAGARKGSGGAPAVKGVGLSIVQISLIDTGCSLD